VASKKTSLGCGGIAFLFIVGAIVGPFVPDSPSIDAPNSGGSSISETATPTPQPAATDGEVATEDPTPTDEAPDVVAKSGSAMKALNRLKVKPMTSGAGYDRDRKFGDAWIDVDGNGCDTRNDILARDFASVSSTDGCLIYKGVIKDKYTGKRIRFTRGQTTSLAVQVDHVVALHNAWKTGAHRLSYSMRVALANDPLNLQAVDGPTNSRKSDSDASWWLPPNRGYQCRYVARQISVKKAYRLWVTPDEKIAMQAVLTTCPRQKVYDTDYPEKVKSGDLFVR
jgi:hypothetical protein